jgi:hypothetical protein
MKKMRFLLMSAVTCFALFATMSLTSCNKDDVEYSQADEAVLYAGVDGKDASSPALYVTLMCFPVTITPIILPMVTVV